MNCRLLLILITSLILCSTLIAQHEKPQQELSGASDSMNITQPVSLQGPYNLDYNREIILLGSGAVMGNMGYNLF